MSLKKFLLASERIQALEKEIENMKHQRDDALGENRKKFQVELNHLKSQLEAEKIIQTKKYEELHRSSPSPSLTSSLKSNASATHTGFGTIGQAPSGKSF